MRNSKRVTLSAFVHSATFPGAVKVESVVRKQLLAIERHREAVALSTQRQGMPLPCAHLDVRSGELLAPSLHDAVEADVILERICRVR